jgi:hypothetical protein
MDVPDIDGKIISITGGIYRDIINSPVFIVITAYGR